MAGLVLLASLLRVGHVTHGAGLVFSLQAMAASESLQEAAFNLNGDHLAVTDQMKECFQRNGFIVVRSAIT